MATGDFKVGCCDFKYTYEPTVTWTKSCPPAKPVSEQVADLERALAEAKAKLAAEQAAKAQTYGQKVAKEFVFILSDGKTFNFKGDHYVRAYANLHDEDSAIGRARSNIAAALDKAYADGAAEQREKCVAACEVYASQFDAYPFKNRYACGCRESVRYVAKHCLTK